jgi:prepilin-type N-terminal cleavage/methylation domain-containing protein
MSNQQSKTQKAFTLIELLVVIAIVGILAGLAVVNMSGATEAARIAKLKVYSNSIRSSLMGNRVSEWKFDEGSGTSTADTVGSNSGMLANGPAWRSGSDCVSGNCLSFDGTNDYVKTAVNFSNEANSAITLEGWVNSDVITNHGSYYRRIIIPGGNQYFSLVLNGGKITVYYNNGVQRELNAPDVVLAGRWYHVVGMYDGANVKLYIDGVQINSTASSLAAIASGPVHIGVYSDEVNGWWDGSIDEVRIYNAALTASAVREDYIAGLDKLLAKGAIAEKNYQQRLSELNSGIYTVSGK